MQQLKLTIKNRTQTNFWKQKAYGDLVERMSPVEGSVRILYKMKMVSCGFDWQSQKMQHSHDPKHSQKQQNASTSDCVKSFRRGDSSHAIRSWLFDEAIQQFWKEEESSKGTVVNFAEGLETQRYRLEDHMDEEA
eukprot:scaffold1867_cov186-Chaetoceros_neogracile.AAC.6